MKDIQWPLAGPQAAEGSEEKPSPQEPAQEEQWPSPQAKRIFLLALNSLNNWPFTEKHPVAPLLFYNEGPTGRGYTNPVFFPL